MKIITRHVLDSLFDKVESLSDNYHDNWRCIYLKLSDKKERYNAELRANFIIKAIIDLMANDEGYIYLCEDGDIFILFQGALKPVVMKLSSHFGDLNPEQLRGQGSDNLFIFFDLGKHWEGFYSLCRSKYAEAGSAVAENLDAHTLVYERAPKPQYKFSMPRAAS